MWFMWFMLSILIFVKVLLDCLQFKDNNTSYIRNYEGDKKWYGSMLQNHLILRCPYKQVDIMQLTMADSELWSSSCAKHSFSHSK